MNIGIIIFIAFFGFLLYYLLFRGPSSDLIFSSRSEAEVLTMQKYLAVNGIRTYVKNSDVRRFHRLGTQISGLVNPSLHVIDPKDYQKAMQLIQNQE